MGKTVKQPVGIPTPEDLLEMLPQDIDNSDKSYVQPDAQLIIDGVSPKGFIPDNAELYAEHIDYFFDVQVGSAIMALTEEDRGRFFEMIRDHSDVLKKVFAPKVPLFEHALGNPWPPVEITSNPDLQHLQCGTIDDCQIIALYDEWLKKNS